MPGSAPGRHQGADARSLALAHVHHQGRAEQHRRAAGPAAEDGVTSQPPSAVFLTEGGQDGEPSTRAPPVSTACAQAGCPYWRVAARAVPNTLDLPRCSHASTAAPGSMLWHRDSFQSASARCSSQHDRHKATVSATAGRTWRPHVSAFMVSLFALKLIESHYGQKLVRCTESKYRQYRAPIVAARAVRDLSSRGAA